MRIYKMTATFGKLEHQPLTLEPGLNVITAPNEWGKSTWCAFLVAMIYGLDTRAKTTKTNLADKEHYAPWSGSPMAGRIDLNWQGRDITIERSTKRRVPLGEFKAYETGSGLPVAELTAANCGQMLLGVEQSVFRRAGFIRHGDLPVTQDEALRRRLNALVTTGDESGAADRLAQSLKELKNRCRYNRTGLLPQAEARREELERTLAELSQLDEQLKTLKQRQGEGKAWVAALENHQVALAAAAAEADAGRVAQARENMDLAENHLLALENICAKLPDREEVQRKTQEVRTLRDEWNAIAMEERMLPHAPLPPAQPARFPGQTVQEALDTVKADRQRYTDLTATRLPQVLYLCGAFAFVLAAVLLVVGQYLLSAGFAGVTVALLALALYQRSSLSRQAAELEKKYGQPDPARWTDPIRAYEEQLRAYNQAQREYKEAQNDVDVRRMVLNKRKESLCGAQEPDAVLEYWQQTQGKWDAYDTARREAAQARSYFENLSAMAKTAQAPQLPDALTYSAEETQNLLEEARGELQRLHSRIGQYQGRMETLGNREELEAQLTQVNSRIARLEQTYEALTIAQEGLAQARAELQRRFAPRIAQRAQELLGRLTGGRYQRLTLGENFDLQAEAEAEDTLHEALWRSDGTVDQLYLALRLAVAEELTPEAPLILDDALVRFDDKRAKAAMDILREEGEKKQVILFSCQSREAAL